MVLSWCYACVVQGTLSTGADGPGLQGLWMHFLGCWGLSSWELRRWERTAFHALQFDRWPYFSSIQVVQNGLLAQVVRRPRLNGVGKPELLLRQQVEMLLGGVAADGCYAVMARFQSIPRGLLLIVPEVSELATLSKLLMVNDGRRSAAIRTITPRVPLQTQIAHGHFSLLHFFLCLLQHPQAAVVFALHGDQICIVVLVLEHAVQYVFGLPWDVLGLVERRRDPFVAQLATVYCEILVRNLTVHGLGAMRR